MDGRSGGALGRANLPSGVPEGVHKEYREAELCASVEAWRAASALLRSTLEKTLKGSGYTTGSLLDYKRDAVAKLPSFVKIEPQSQQISQHAETGRIVSIRK